MIQYNFEELEGDELIDELYDELDASEPNLEKISALINAGCDIYQGFPLLVAATFGNLDVVKLLVEAGVDVNKFDPDDNETAYFRAVFNGHSHVANYLEPLTSPSLCTLARELIKINPPCPPSN